ncbi:MAG TPA: hypothetical protein VGN81_41845 [Pseudonocardiaceae bacterium]|jgi:hypothetical protein
MPEIWQAVITWLTIALVVPLTWEAARRPRRSGARLGFAAVAFAVFVVDVAALLDSVRVPPDATVSVFVGGEALALVLICFAVRRTVRARRAEREPRVGADQFIAEPALLWVRPHPPIEDTAHGPLLSRVDAWLSADGPRPSAGWWHNGGLQLDQRGPALVDAAGLRHPFPAGVTGMVNPSVPRSLLLVDSGRTVLVRLPTTGFASAELTEFALAARWTYTTQLTEFFRDDPDLLDLRRCVVDHVAKDDGAVARVWRRLAGQR